MTTTLLLALAMGVGCGQGGTPPAGSPDEAAASGGDDRSRSDDPAEGDDSARSGGGSRTGGHRHADETRTTAVIADVIKQHRDKARACYEKAARDIPRLEGDVVIHFVLDPDGKVQSAALNEERSTIQVPSLTSCVIGVIESLPFPGSSRRMETVVNYPFNFRP